MWFSWNPGGIQSTGNLAGGNRKPVIGVNSNEEDLEAAIGVGLGELAEITVNNDADPVNYDVRVSGLWNLSKNFCLGGSISFGTSCLIFTMTGLVLLKFKRKYTSF